MASKLKHLQVVSQVVELKPNCKYLFVFDQRSGVRPEEIDELLKELQKLGMRGLGLRLEGKDSLTVYEQEEVI